MTEPSTTTTPGAGQRGAQLVLLALVGMLVGCFIVLVVLGRDTAAYSAFLSGPAVALVVTGLVRYLVAR